MNREIFAAFARRRKILAARSAGANCAAVYRTFTGALKSVERYLTALAAVHVQTPLAEQAAQFCRPVRRDGHRYRALNPLGRATLNS
jgi:hypothetical protein